MSNIKSTGGGKPPPVSKVKGWARLIFAAMLIVLAVYLVPNVERLPLIGDRITALRESDIEVGAWYYDDVKKYFEAEKYIREARGLDYPQN